MSSIDPWIYTRRDFMKTLTIAGLGLTMPSFLTETVAAQQAAAVPGFPDEKILVVVQLGGGNDGLNTVIPIGNDLYSKLRPRIAVPKEKQIVLSSDLAFNQGLKAMAELYDEGNLGVIQGVGYPNPDRSHFRSMEIWQTGVDSDKFSSSGWIGRYFDNCCQGRPLPTAGVNVGGESPQAFSGKSGAGVSFQDPQMYRWLEGKDPRATREIFEQANKTSQQHQESGSTLDFLRHTTANAMVSSDRVLRASRTTRKSVDYPDSKLAKSLKTIATLIAGGLPTRIYYTSLGGFDTHANQLGPHENLLRQFSTSMAAFQKDLKAIGAADRVMTMAFSEFGRRVGENASGGTDHGTAGPVFLMGSGAVPGLHGKAPNLADLDDGDLKHTVDFRGVYSEIIGNWLKGDSGKVLGGAFFGPGVVKQA